MDLRILTLLACSFTVAFSQGGGPLAEYLANHLQVTYTVISNLEPGAYGQFQGRIDLINTGDLTIVDNSWQIYFCSIRLMEVPYLRNRSSNGAELGNSRIKVYHMDGCLHKLAPMADFPGFPSAKTVPLPFSASDWTVARTDMMPRWYVTAPNEDALIIAATAGEDLEFVSNFTNEEQWKRRDNDLYNPPTPEERFEHNIASTVTPSKGQVIPTPVEHEMTDEYVDITTGDWVIVSSSDELVNEAYFLAEKLGLPVVNVTDMPSFRYINLIVGNVLPVANPEAYQLNVMADTSNISITGNSPAGVFYGIQTLLSLAEDPMGICESQITDHPRFPYRGMHIDTSRNFHGKEEVLKLLDVMAMYKLNKFHFHFTDDEGWRLEIPGIPEATEVGSNRCFDLDENECILSQLGSGPTSSTSGSGYYSVDDYREILQYAENRHIEVIPEFDMPGHGHAIIRAMEARYRKYNATDMPRATEYLLSDFDDDSEYESAQMFKSNAINPCINSTYTFIRHLMKQVKLLHQDIQQLNTFNYGGDEVPNGAWEKSPKCEEFTANTPGLNLTKGELLRYFAIRVGEIANEEGLDLAAWEDGLGDANGPYERHEFPNDNVYMYAWSNVWEWGHGEKAYIFANADYKVVLSHATHLYFDHPQEADPEERGYYWATRYTDTYQTFGYYPDEVYNNIGVTRFGEHIDKEEFCEPDDRCIPLEDAKRENILGIQGELWSETSRTSSQLHSMIFPRLLALAERAWHKGDWEDTADRNMLDNDWEKFSNNLGHKELQRLDKMGIMYYVPPPGALVTSSDDGYTLDANCHFPGLPIMYSLDNGNTWTTFKDPVSVPAETTIQLHVRSADGTRRGRMVTVQTGGPISDASNMKSSVFVMLFLAACHMIKLI